MYIEREAGSGSAQHYVRQILLAIRYLQPIESMWHGQHDTHKYCASIIMVSSPAASLSPSPSPASSWSTSHFLVQISHYSDETFN